MPSSRCVSASTTSPASNPRLAAVRPTTAGGSGPGTGPTGTLIESKSALVAGIVTSEAEPGDNVTLCGATSVGARLSAATSAAATRELTFIGTPNATCFLAGSSGNVALTPSRNGRYVR